MNGHLRAVTTEERQAVLDQAVDGLRADGWKFETRRDYQRVLVGHNTFRRVLVRRRWRLHDCRELVDVDPHGNLTIRDV